MTIMEQSIDTPPRAPSPDHAFGTLAVHAGSPIDPVTGAVIEPVSSSSLSEKQPMYLSYIGPEDSMAWYSYSMAQHSVPSPFPLVPNQSHLVPNMTTRSRFQQRLRKPRSATRSARTNTRAPQTPTEQTLKRQSRRSSRQSTLWHSAPAARRRRRSYSLWRRARTSCPSRTCTAARIGTLQRWPAHTGCR